MFAAKSHTSRHHIAIAAMACLCVLLGGPSCAAGAESLIIAGATYCEPGVSGPGWAWTDAGHLELDGYAGDATAADGEKRSLERTIEGFRGFLYCLEGAQEKGIVYGSGAWKKGDIKESPALNEAYEMGRHA